MPKDYVDTLVIGGGQAGLTVSHMLSRRGCRHLVLERARIAERWRSERWDGLRFQFPNWSVKLPDFPFRHADPDGFCTSAEIVDFFTAYADFIAAPIRCGVEVTRLTQGAATPGFVAETSGGAIEAANVVVATGPYQRAVFPALLPQALDLFQVHASTYRAPDQLPPGAVLVVGSGASGAQIAEELRRAGRRVYLSVGHHRRMPRRYRGRDLIWWISTLGLDQTPVAKRGPDKALPLITGAYGGHTIDFRDFAAQGITLIGRLVAADNGIVEIAPDLGASLASGDQAYAGFLDLVDRYVAQHEVDVPEEPEARAVRPDPADLLQPLRRLDLQAAGISAVIWSTGYACDFSWIDLPVFNAQREPVHRDGITDVPGLYFIGLQWLSRMNSSFLAGVGQDALHLAEHIAARHVAAQHIAEQRAD
jgi:putative flavoprotein involved in K+ transport